MNRNAVGTGALPPSEADIWSPKEGTLHWCWLPVTLTSVERVADSHRTAPTAAAQRGTASSARDVRYGRGGVGIAFGSASVLQRSGASSTPALDLSTSRAPTLPVTLDPSRAAVVGRAAIAARAALLRHSAPTNLPPPDDAWARIAAFTVSTVRRGSLDSEEVLVLIRFTTGADRDAYSLLASPILVSDAQLATAPTVTDSDNADSSLASLAPPQAPLSVPPLQVPPSLLPMSPAAVGTSAGQRPSAEALATDGSDDDARGDTKPSSQSQPSTLTVTTPWSNAVLRRLRRLRRRPDIMLRNPDTTWALLVRAAHVLDTSNHLSVFAVPPPPPSGGPGSAAARFDVGRSRAPTGESLGSVSGTGQRKGNIPLGVSSVISGVEAPRRPPRHPAQVTALPQSASHHSRSNEASVTELNSALPPATADTATVNGRYPRGRDAKSDASVVMGAGAGIHGDDVHTGNARVPAESAHLTQAYTDAPLGDDAPFDSARSATGAAGIGDDDSTLLVRPLRLHHWLALIPRFVPLLADTYSAEAIWAELTGDSEPVRIRSVDAGSGAGRAPPPPGAARGPGLAPADPLVVHLAWTESWERVLRYDAFERYALALARPLLRPPAAWVALREALCLDPRELVVKVEEMMEAVLLVRLVVHLPQSTSTLVQPSQRRDNAAAGVLGNAKPASTVLPAIDACAFPLPVPQALLPAPTRRHRMHRDTAASTSPRGGDVGGSAPGSTDAALGRNDADGNGTVAAVSGGNFVAGVRGFAARAQARGAFGRLAAAASAGSPAAAATGPPLIQRRNTRGGRGGTDSFGWLGDAKPLRDFMSERDAAEIREKRAALYESDETWASTDTEDDNGARHSSRPYNRRRKEGKNTSMPTSGRPSQGGDRAASAPSTPRPSAALKNENGPTIPPLPASTDVHLRAHRDLTKRGESRRERRARGDSSSSLSSSSSRSRPQRSHVDGEGDEGVDDILLEGGLDDFMEGAWLSRDDGRRSGAAVRRDSNEDNEPFDDTGHENGDALDGGRARSGTLAFASEWEAAAARGNGSGRRRTAADVTAADATGAGAAAAAPARAPQQQRVVARFAAATASLLRNGAGRLQRLAGAPLGVGTDVDGGGKTAAAYAGYGVHGNVLASLLTTGQVAVRVTGTIVITERNLYLAAPRGEVLVVPLSSIADVGPVRTTVSTLGLRLGRTSDNGLHIHRCEVRRVPIDPEADAESIGGTPLQSLFTCVAALHGLPVDITPPGSESAPSRRGILTATVLDGATADAGARPEAGDEIVISRADEGGVAGASIASALSPPPALLRRRTLDREKSFFAAASPPGVPSVAAASTSVSAAAGTLAAPSTATRGTTTGTLAARASLTLVFSKVKDFVLGRGEERVGGGRRRVISDTLDELVAAHAITAEYEPIVRRLLAAAKATAEGDTEAAAIAAGIALPPPPVRDATSGMAPALPPFRLPAMSRWLLHAASGDISLASLLRGPMRPAAWAALLSRDRATDAAFPRRLQLFAAINLVRTRALLKATGRFADDLRICAAYEQGASELAARAVPGIMLRDDPRWLLTLAAWASHEREIRRRRTELRSVFEIRRFREELDRALDYFVYPINAARHVAYYLVAWESPPLSAAALLAALLIAWHDLLHYALPLLLVAHCAAVLALGAMSEPARAAVTSLLSRGRGAKARNLLQRLRNFRTSLGTNQERLHRLNTVVLKLRSLYTWREPGRSRAFAVALAVAALVVLIVPARILFAAFMLAQFTKPLRSRERGVVTLAFLRFWSGLPVPSVSDPVYEPLPLEDDHDGGGGSGAGDERGGSNGGTMRVTPFSTRDALAGDLGATSAVQVIR